MTPTQSVKPSKAETARVSAKVPKQRPSLVDRLMRLTALESGKAIPFEVAAKRGSRVCIAGTFNNWDPTTHPLTYHPEDGLFRATLLNGAGTHEYKIVVNGAWCSDPECADRAPNEHGTHNSVRHVR